MKTVGRGSKLEAEGQELGGVLEEGQQAPPRLGGLGERSELPSLVRPGLSPDHPEIFKTIISTQNGLSLVLPSIFTARRRYA